MLQELQLTNFKSFAGESDPIPFAPVTILVGEGLGKGRVSAMTAVSGNWRSLKSLCPELQQFQDGIATWLERAQ